MTATTSIDECNIKSTATKTKTAPQIIIYETQIHIYTYTRAANPNRKTSIYIDTLIHTHNTIQHT